MRRENGGPIAALEHKVASGLLIPKFVSERAANAYELRNRTTEACPVQLDAGRLRHARCAPLPNQPRLPGLVRFILPEAGKPAAGWGGVGGGGSNWRMQLCAITTTPFPSPPPTQVGPARLAQDKAATRASPGRVGREQTAVAARTDSISTASALVGQFPNTSAATRDNDALLG
jgi:hypothetical protein